MLDRFHRGLVVPVVLAILATALPAAAQDRIEGVIEDTGFSRIKIAVPDPPDDPTAAEVTRVVREDLDFAGFFDVVDPGLYDLVRTPDGSEVPHEDWLSIGADALIETSLKVNGEQVDFEARLYDNESATLLFWRRYRGRTDMLRRVAHQLSDDLVHHYTGEDGVAMSRIAFVSKHGDGKEIYIMDFDGHRVRRLTTSGTINLSPAWSPAADELSFTSWRGRQPGVYVMSADGVLGHLTTVGGDLSAAPDWSPDGRKLAYVSDVDGDTEIYVLDRSTGRNTRLTRNPAIDTGPSFSPNGREIAFTSDRTGSPQIYLMDTEGLNVRRISWSGGYNTSPAWSPRGDRVAYVSRVEGKFDIVILDLNDDRVRRVTRGEGDNENPRWSANGRHLVFASNRAGSYDIYTVRSDGTDVRRLTRGGDSFTPDWSR